jgi:hypothetical protein
LSPLKRAVIQGRWESPQPNVLIASLARDEATEHTDHGAPAMAPARTFTLDLAPFGNRGYLVPGNFSSAFAREVNVIKQSLWRVFRDSKGSAAERPVVLLIASTKPREGKSFLSINLAFSFLFADSRRVLLVDADAERHDLSKSLGVEEAPGLTDMLQEDGIALEDCLLRSEREQLEIISAGTASAAGANWTRRGCERLMGGLRRLAAPDALVVIDTPPLLTAPVAYLLADHVDHVLFIVGAGQARVDEIQLAVAQLPDQSRVSFVVNRAEATRSAAGYAHGQHT